VATVKFILQGFTTSTHRDALRDLFGISDIRTILLNVAYVKESGVEEIENELKAHASRATVLAGIRNDITSYQGLTRLHRIRGLTLYAVDTGSRHVVFHPKLYLVRGKTAAKVIVGSANLTLGG
jgi:HKD family nuclease